MLPTAQSIPIDMKGIHIIHQLSNHHYIIYNIILHIIKF
jgi:hypothetical protein